LILYSKLLLFLRSKRALSSWYRRLGEFLCIPEPRVECFQ
jgi:hypothetical protein